MVNTIPRSDDTSTTDQALWKSRRPDTISDSTGMDAGWLEGLNGGITTPVMEGSDDE